MLKHTLTNFNVPIITKERFDRVCQISGRTRTSVLIELMERYVFDQVDVIETRNRQFDRIDGIITKNQSKNHLKDRGDVSLEGTGIGRQNLLESEDSSDRVEVR